MHVACLTGVYIHQDEPWYLNILCVRVTPYGDFFYYFTEVKSKIWRVIFFKYFYHWEIIEWASGFPEITENMKCRSMHLRWPVALSGECDSPVLSLSLTPIDISKVIWLPTPYLIRSKKYIKRQITCQQTDTLLFHRPASLWHYRFVSVRTQVPYSKTQNQNTNT